MEVLVVGLALPMVTQTLLESTCQMVERAMVEKMPLLEPYSQKTLELMELKP